MNGLNPFSCASIIVFFAFLAIAVIMAAKRLDVVRPLRLFGIGIVIADWLMMVSLLEELDTLEALHEKLTFGLPAFISSAVMLAGQMVTLNIDYVTYMAASKGLLLFFTVLCVLTPVVWGGVVLTLFERFSSWLSYQLFRQFVPVYFFSELHEKSLALARDIRKERKQRCLCIFCGNSERISSELKEEAKSSSFLLFRKPETAYVKSPQHAQIFFEISANQDENLSHCTQLIASFTAKYGEADYSRTGIFLFSEQEEAPLLLSSTDKKGLPVVVVDRDRFFANDLLFSHPLYEALATGEKVFSLLIVGAGRLGVTILKTALTCGQLDSDYTIKITVIDADALRCEKMLRLECPELFNGEYRLSFHNADVCTDDFSRCLDNHGTDVNYVCVCGESDEHNIHTALYLRSYYLRRDVTADKRPFIAVAVRNGTKNAVIPEFTAVPRERMIQKKWGISSPDAKNYNLFPFYGDNTLYSARVLDTPLEKISLNVHFAYEDAFTGGKADEHSVRKTYYRNETDTRSNRANALHIRYKLFLLGYDMKAYAEASEQEKEESGSLLQELQRTINEKILPLSQAEHKRWNAFMRGEGWCSASFEQARQAHTHKIQQAKLHGCLCSWDELDPFIKAFDAKFKEYDACLVRDIPILLGLQPGKDNISGVHYVLVRRQHEIHR